MRLSASIAGYVFAVCLFPMAAVAGPVPESETDRAFYVLTRLGFGPSGDDVQRVARLGVRTYIDQQLHPERVPLPASLQQQLAALSALHLSPEQLFIDFRETRKREKDAKADGNSDQKKALKVELNEPVHQAREAKLLRAIESPHQLEELLVDFWFNHFNVYAEKEIDRVFVGGYEEDSIRPYVFGRFRDMLGATAKSAAMLYYLDQWKNVVPGSKPLALTRNGKPPKQDEVGLNENYAREVMELHTLGVDGGYTQADVTQLARILTGWGYGAAEMRQRSVLNNSNKDAAREEIEAQNHSVFFFNAEHHDNGTKVFLGRTFGPAGQSEGEAALDMLAYSPVTAHHVSYELAQYFVSDTPPEALVRRMTDAWIRTGGDLRQVTKTMIESSEFWDRQYRGAKYRTPLQYVVSAVRASAAPVDTDVLIATLKKMGEAPYDCLTPDGYKNTVDAWLNPSATADRLSFATALGTGKLEQIHVMRNADGTPDRQNDNSPAVPLNAAAIEATLDNFFSPNTAQAIAAVDPRMQAAAVLGSPEMMRR